MILLHFNHRTLIALLVIAMLSIGYLPALAQDEVTLTDYNLGEGSIIQERFPDDSRFYDMPAILQGVIAVPSGEGPFPVALFLHGSYVACTAPTEEMDVYPCPPEFDLKKHEGFSYLAEALAEAGYLTIIPDISAEYNNGYAEPLFGERTSQIIDLHLNALADGEDFGVPIGVEIDFEKIVVATHSRGGQLAIKYLYDENASYDFSALVMITPADVAAEEIVPDDLPTAVIISECDGDVGIQAPLNVIENQLPTLRPNLTAIYTLEGANHNGYNTKLESDLGDACDDSELISPESQQEFLAGFVPDFFDLALALGSSD